MAQRLAQTPEDVILAEAKAGSYADLLAIASVVENRARALGLRPEQVVANQREFNAYGKAMPPGIERHRDLARRAIQEVVTTGPVHAGTFYATPKATKNLPGGLQPVAQTPGHQFFADPQNRAIGSAVGYIKPDPSYVAGVAPANNVPGLTNIAGDPANTLYDVVEAQPPGFNQSRFAPTGVPPAAPAAPSVPAPSSMALGFKSPTVASSMASLAPQMQAAVANVSRGLHNPADYTITSAAEERRGLPSLTHVRDRGAIDARTRGLTQKQADDLAVAAMYSPEVQSIGWNNSRFSPHAHIGTSTAYGRGLNRNSNISGLSPDVQKAMQEWDANRRTGAAFSPMVPESIAPMPGDRRAALENQPRGILSPEYTKPTAQAPAMARAAPTAAPSFAPSASTAPAMAAASGRMSPTGILSPEAAQMASPAARNAMAEISPDQKAGLTAALQQQAAQMTAAPAAPARPEISPAQKASLTAALQAQAAQMVAAVPPVAPAVPAYAPTPAPTLAPSPVSSGSFPAAPAPPSPATGLDVWGGRATSGTATNGNQMTRNPDGTVSMTSSKYGYTETMNPDGSYRSTTAPGIFGLDKAVSGLLGGIDMGSPARSGGFNAQPGAGQRGKPGDMKTVAATLAGSMIGGLLGGPLGAAIGGHMTRNMAQGRNPFDSSKYQDSFGWSMPSPGRARSIFDRGFTPGLGFPDRPSAPANPGRGGLSAFGEAAARGEHGRQAEKAAREGGKGLY